jgi:hypothetical protein
MIPLNQNQNNYNYHKATEKSFLTNKKNNPQANLETIPNTKPDALHSKSSSKAEGIIEFIFIKFSNSVRLIGPLFAFCLIMFVIAVANTAFCFIIPFWMKNFHFIFCFLYIIALYLLFSILFNYLLAVLVKPGSLADIKNSKYYRKNDPLRVSTNLINFENSKLSENLKKNFNEEKKKNEESAPLIKIRYKTNENSHLNINGNNNSFGSNLGDNYKLQDDLKTLADMETSENNNKNTESNY